MVEECHEAWDVGGMKAVPDTKIDLAKSKEALCVPEGRASEDMLDLRSSIEERDCAQS